MYIDGFKCDGCGYLDEDKNKELKEKVEKSHKETENYKKEMQEKVSKLKKSFRAIVFKEEHVCDYSYSLNMVICDQCGHVTEDYNSLLKEA